jgi:hypothetical protein
MLFGVEVDRVSMVAQSEIATQQIRSAVLP